MENFAKVLRSQNWKKKRCRIHEYWKCIISLQLRSKIYEIIPRNPIIKGPCKSVERACSNFSILWILPSQNCSIFKNSCTMVLHIVKPSECTATHGLLSKLNGAKSMFRACLVIWDQWFFFPPFFLCCLPGNHKWQDFATIGYTGDPKVDFFFKSPFFFYTVATSWALW